MRALILQHTDLNPPGIWADALEHAGVDVHLARPDRDGAPADVAEYDLVVALGGPQSARPDAAPAWLDAEVEAIRQGILAGVAFLGVCLGAQMLARAAGGECREADGFSLGLVDVGTAAAAHSDPVFAPLDGTLTAFAFHGDSCTVAPGARRLAASASCDVEALRWGRTAYGLQFHLEATPDDVATWLDVLPWLADHPALGGDGGVDAFLDRYAAAAPAMRDAAVGITRRWVATALSDPRPTPDQTRSKTVSATRLTCLDLADPFGFRGRRGPARPSQRPADIPTPNR